MAGLGMFVLLFAFASLAGLRAHIAEWDEHWLQRKAEAYNRTLETYDPNPEHVVAHLNMHTNRYVYKSLCLLFLFKLLVACVS